MNTLQSYPNWSRPNISIEFLGTLGVNDIRDSYIILNEEKIPWSSNKTGFFNVMDYAKSNFNYIKSIAYGRRMEEYKLKRKVDLVQALQLWDVHFKNTTGLS
jgi:hypothetical protein